MKEAGIEITFRQSFFSDPAVPVKNLKVGWPGVVDSDCRGTGLREQWWVGEESRVGERWFVFVFVFCF